MNRIRNLVRASCRALCVLTAAYLTPSLVLAAGLPSLKLSIPTDEYLVGEPIVASLCLRNEHTETPVFFSSNEDFANTVTFIFTFATQDGSLVGETEVRGQNVTRVAAMLGILDTGPIWQCDKMFLPQAGAATAGGQGRLLEAGEYVLTAKVWWSPPRQYGESARQEPESVFISSNPVKVRIIQPTGADARALALLKSESLALFWSGESGGQPQAITDLIAKYPDSPYARHARARLVLDRMRAFWFTQHRHISDSEKAELRNLLARAETDAEDPKLSSLKDNLLLLRARMQKIFNEAAAAVQTLRDLVSQYPDSDAAPAARKLLEKVSADSPQAAPGDQ